MEKYAARIRDIKLRGPRKKKKKGSAAADDDDEEEDSMFGLIDVSAASSALMVKWLRMARVRMEEQHFQRSIDRQRNVDNMLKLMPEELDWYYGSDLRTQGENLSEQGRGLATERR